MPSNGTGSTSNPNDSELHSWRGESGEHPLVQLGALTSPANSLPRPKRKVPQKRRKKGKGELCVFLELPFETGSLASEARE